jgi:hypothetical protein
MPAILVIPPKSARPVQEAEGFRAQEPSTLTEKQRRLLVDEKD